MIPEAVQAIEAGEGAGIGHVVADGRLAAWAEQRDQPIAVIGAERFDEPVVQPEEVFADLRWRLGLGQGQTLTEERAVDADPAQLSSDPRAARDGEDENHLVFGHLAGLLDLSSGKGLQHGIPRSVDLEDGRRGKNVRVTADLGVDLLDGLEGGLYR